MKKIIGALALFCMMSVSLLGNVKVEAAGSTYDYLTGTLYSHGTSNQKVVLSDGRFLIVTNTGWTAYTKVLVKMNNQRTVDTRDDTLVSITKLNY